MEFDKIVINHTNLVGMPAM